ncbi:MAG: hypothetical protein SGPRY_001546, partial [Prymnesium sp.]
PSSSVPAVLVFENARYQAALSQALEPQTIEVVDCAPLGACNPPSPYLAARTIASVGATTRNLSTFRAETLPNLRLVQSAWYIAPDPADVPPTVNVALYFPDWSNETSAEYGADTMSEWMVGAVLAWRHRLAESEALFRRCAWSSEAPLSCPPVTDLTDHLELGGKDTTIGVIGFGTVGKNVAEHFSALKLRVIVSTHSGPYSPVPAGLAWFGNDNDKVIRESDFLIIAVSETCCVNMINKTAFGLMKSNAVLLPLLSSHVDYGALYDALRSKQIGGAILDGTWPHPTLRFQDLDNVRMTPNVMMQPRRFWDQSAAYVAENLKLLLAGKPLKGIVRERSDK